MASAEKGIEIVTFGCRLNTYESEVMRREAQTAGLGELEGGAIIINTCAVTGEAVRQAKQSIRKARREHPGAKIIVTGCAAQTAPQDFSAMDEVDLVLGNEEKLHSHNYRALPDFGVNDFEKARVNDIFSVRETASHMVDAIEGRARAFVQVQNGCDHRCTFCIIPYGRGNSRSVPMGAVTEQVRRLVAGGYAEVVITGVDITSYGHDLPGAPTLGQLCRRLLNAVPELKRLRLSSIDSVEVDDDLMHLIAHDERMLPHMHLSLQAGDNMILKRMKRRHSREQAIAFCRQVRERRPDMVFGADIIAGFPTETEEMFENSLRLVDECGLMFLHVFPFSARQGTPAARMPQVNGAVVKERAARLRAEGAVVRDRLQTVYDGTLVPFLAEKMEDGRIVGHSDHFVPVTVDGVLEAGQVGRMRVTGHTGGRLSGVLLDG
jgi:threonylcarbamoyladenosine tRNA methylthiotransferase MtaB